jgi:Glucose-6-phosphate dehydrogenase, NAD binding domain/Glucose-6-phosphate dehydrogenase, C-terminal domain
MNFTENPSAPVAGACNSCALVIFGGTGDLAWRKLVPSLFNLYVDKTLPEKMAIIAVDRADIDNAALRKRLRGGVKKFARAGKPKDWRNFEAHLSYCRGDFENSKTYVELARRLAKLDKDWNAKATHIFHLAVPPSLFSEIPKMLAKAGLASDRERSRVVIEKPIAYDLESTRKLNRALTHSFHESQIFRIDHYLGKETVQNILAFRFANPLFEPIWDQRFIDHVAITVAEQIGVEHRGGYYDHAGALRDMVQNHLLQLLCLVAMEAPVSFGADEIRNKKVDVLHSIRAQTQIAPWLLGVNLHYDAFVRLDRNDEPHGSKIRRGFWGKRSMRYAAKLDRDLRSFHRQSLSGAQIKRHAVPPPVVHKQFQRCQSLRIRIRCHTRFIAICADLLPAHFSRAILATHGACSDFVCWHLGAARGRGTDRAWRTRVLFAARCQQSRP